MKFSDGYWQVRDGRQTSSTPRRPLRRRAADDRGAHRLAPTRPITGRGDTLNRPTATVTAVLAGARRDRGADRAPRRRAATRGPHSR